MLIASATSGAKIILTGEHAVVYNYPAIAIPFNGVQTTVNIYKRVGALTIESKFHTGLLKDGSETILGLQQLVFHLLKHFNQPQQDLHFEVVSNIESQRGMGSSAALAVAATKAIYQAFGNIPSNQELVSHAMFAEKFFHQNPSGLDVHTIVYQKPIWYIKNSEYQNIDINLSAFLVIIDTNLSSRTKDAVNKVWKMKTEHLKTTNQILKAIGAVSLKAKNALATNDLKSLTNLLATNQKYLKALGVSNKVIDATIKKAQKLGLKGLKITGGGLGGCVIGLTDDLEVVNQIKANFSSVWVDNLGVNHES